MFGAIERERGPQKRDRDQPRDRDLVPPLQRVRQEIAEHDVEKDDRDAARQHQPAQDRDKTRGGPLDQRAPRVRRHAQSVLPVSFRIASNTGLVSGCWPVKLFHRGLTSSVSFARSIPIGLTPFCFSTPNACSAAAAALGR